MSTCKKIRIGNDFGVRWTLFRCGRPEPLTGRSLTLLMTNEYRSMTVKEFMVEDNAVTFLFAGKDQRETGTYTLTLVENEGTEGMFTVDACRAFRLVPVSCEADVYTPGTTLYMESDITVPMNGLSAYELAVKNGFAGTEPEWLASLIGPQGKPFTYDDFTPKQIAELQKPATDAAKEANEATDNANESAKKANEAATLAEQAKELLFRDMWETACGTYGGYNEKTGFYELNGLTDITYEQAIAIYNAGPIRSTYCAGQYCGVNIRTNLPLQTSMTGAGGSDNGYYCDDLFANCRAEVIRLNVRFRPRGMNPYSGTFRADNCKTILGTVDFFFVTNITGHCFGNSLESATITSIGFNFNISNCAKIDLPTVKTMVERSRNGDKVITITVHPDVYAKLTDEANTEWHAVLLAANEKNISFATVE